MSRMSTTTLVRAAGWVGRAYLVAAGCTFVTVAAPYRWHLHQANQHFHALMQDNDDNDEHDNDYLADVTRHRMLMVLHVQHAAALRAPLEFQEQQARAACHPTSGMWDRASRATRAAWWHLVTEPLCLLVHVPLGRASIASTPPIARAPPISPAEHAMADRVLDAAMYLFQAQLRAGLLAEALALVRAREAEEEQASQELEARGRAADASSVDA
jgi:hypothetical protein